MQTIDSTPAPLGLLVRRWPERRPLVLGGAAALFAAGLKTVEVRTWPTRRRGPVLIHAGKVADDRPEAWARVVPGA